MNKLTSFFATGIDHTPNWFKVVSRYYYFFTTSINNRITLRNSALNPVFDSSGTKYNFSISNYRRSGYRIFYISLRNYWNYLNINSFLQSRFYFIQSFLQNLNLIKQRLYSFVNSQSFNLNRANNNNPQKHYNSFEYLCFRNIISIANY